MIDEDHGCLNKRSLTRSVQLQTCAMEEEDYKKKDIDVEDLDDSDDDKKNGPPNFQKLHSN